MKKGTQQILKSINIISWIVFIGLCINTGTIIFSFFVSLFINQAGASNLHSGLNLSDLYRFSTGHYSAVATLIILISGLKAYIFYLVIRIFLKINFVHPFSPEVSSIISGISYYALFTGLLTLVADRYCVWLTGQGVVFHNLHPYLGGFAEYMLLGGVIFIIAQVFKRGIEIQSENELTI